MKNLLGKLGLKNKSEPREVRVTLDDLNKHMFMVLGADEGQTPAGFYCVKCRHFWAGPLDSLAFRSGSECPSDSDQLLMVDPSAG